MEPTPEEEDKNKGDRSLKKLNTITISKKKKKNWSKFKNYYLQVNFLLYKNY